MSNEIKDIAVGQISTLPTNVANKPLYILVVEDPNVKGHCRYYLSSKIDKTASVVEILGYETTSAQSSKLKSWNDVTELAKKEEIEHVNVIFPWNRVINIKNVTYKSKSA